MKLKNTFWVFITFILVVLSTNQTCKNVGNYKDGNISRLSCYAKVWGFLKYYHPRIARGEINWDSVLINSIPIIEKSQNNCEFNLIIDSLLVFLGNISQCDTCQNTEFPDSLMKNYDLSWIKENDVLEKSTKTKLEKIREYKTAFNNYYVQSDSLIGNTYYLNEINYDTTFFPEKELRLLSLFRYWNIINYFFPYKYLINDNWNDVLYEYVSIFLNAKDALEYHLAVLKLTHEINDSHSWVISEPISKFWGYYNLPIILSMTENNVLIVDFWSDSLGILNNLRKGDIILRINKTPVDELINTKLNYFGGSNKSAIYRDMLSLLLCSRKKKNVDLTIMRDEDTIFVTAHRYWINYLYQERKKSIKNEKWKIINENIGYVDMASLTQADVDSMMHILKNMKAIIFDIRFSSNGTLFKIADHLKIQKSDFTMWFHPNIDYPGILTYDHNLQCGPDSLNENYYKGLVVILVSNWTQSHAEFTAMALQTSPNCITIGNQTAGADGNISKVSLPGGIITYFSGAGLTYPNGSEVQRKGIKLDIEVTQTINGILNGQDETLNEALNYIRKNNFGVKTPF